MDGQRQVAPIAPPARIRRRTSWELAHLPRALEVAATLLAHARLADEAVARAAMSARLAALAPALLGSPYWSQVMRARGLSPGDLRCLDDLHHFPALDRPTLAANWRELPAHDRGLLDDAVVIKSSGTTGDPVNVVRDAFDLLYMWAVLRFFLRQLDLALPPRPRVVLLCALPGGLEYSVRLPLVDRGALHRISLARPRPLERLRRVAPAVLFSDPAGLAWLAAQPAPPVPRLVLTSAQHFSSHQRTQLANVVESPIINYYSTSETGPIAWECLSRAGRFHVLSPDVWVESVARELVVTRLRPSILPLLRYRTGDAGAVERDSCPCGFHGWTITGFLGRRACAFFTPSGAAVDAWQLAWIFKHYPLRHFRLTQIASDRFDLELVPAADGGVRDLVPRLEAALCRLGWPRAEVHARAVESLAEASSKPEPFRQGWR